MNANRLGKILTLLLLAATLTVSAQNASPKREMRAAWIASVENIDWPSKKGLTTAEQQKEFIAMLDSLKSIGINAVIVQVRPNSDALYQSTMEPWSKYLTGTMGAAPSPYYDPLKFMVEESHKRAIEFHAWFNPYRTVAIDEPNVDPKHITRTHPEWLVTYGKMRYFDPGLPQTREYVTKVIQDVVRRYDLDGVHFDDYFYPYKLKGVEFNDSASFAAYPRGFTANQREDWRRDNVNLIIKMLSDSIHTIKPYVKFGISPFGIWRNKASDPRGSETNGGQNYDDLYADILLWMQNGWIDYVVPQLYWNIGFKVADYDKLAKWWAKNSFGVPVYVGQGAYRVDAKSKTKEWADGQEMNRQIAINRTVKGIEGSVYFSAKSLLNNPANSTRNIKQKYYQYPALVPTMPGKDSIKPDAPTIIEVHRNRETTTVEWNPAAHKDTNANAPRYYVVYKLKKGDSIDDPANIIAITPEQSVKLTHEKGTARHRYNIVVTTLDRLYNESEPSDAVRVKL